MPLSHGFELLQEAEIEELNTKARLYCHAKTGAELLSLENNDENKTFGIAFRTPPEDSTGLPHIMEHSVLGGSRKYRVKEPFVELVKGSMKTFLNALTFPDMTAYPVASTNTQDFYNLVDVYLDAVLHPLITPHHLEQEGWHYELEDDDDPLIYKGVVFNEMKGAYSSPESLLYRYKQEVLFPDTPYRHDSGGDPTVMPNLTYEQFRTFHETYYHPSNARIFFYGDDDPEERLRLVDEYLQEFERLDVDSAVPPQPPFSEPRQFTFPYSVDKEDDAGRKAYVSVNWVLPPGEDATLRMGLGVLSYALLGTPASPLRKILTDSGLGDDVIGGGFSSRMQQMTFSVGLKGTAVADADAIESLILDTLSELAADGFEEEMIEAAMNTIEFSLRENNTGSFPRGLSLMFRALSTWLYDDDPLAPLAFETPLAAVKDHLANDPTYLQDLIRTYLLKNIHRATLILEPDPDLQRRLETAEKEKLAQVKARLNQNELQQIIENTRRLKARQAQPDDPAELAKIPRLTLDDLEKENKLIPKGVSQAHGAELLYHDLFTNGIVYLEVGLNVHVLPADLLPYVKLFGRSLVEMGTEQEDFVKLSQRIGRKTGGVYPTTHISAKREQPDAAAWLFLRGKATMDQTEEMLAILRDVLLTVDLDNQERFRQLALRARARQEAGLIPGGHGVVNRRLRSHFSESGWASEQVGGVAYLFFLRKLVEQVDSDWPAVLAKLETMRDLLVNRQRMVINVTLDADNWTIFQPQLLDFLAALPEKNVPLAEWDWRQTAVAEGLTLPAQVNYVAKGANLRDFGYQTHGSTSVITNYLRTTYLWEKVRVQGGAYGALVSHSNYTGVFSLYSYRDPNLLGTLAVYDGVADFLRRPVSEDELTKSIIGAISAIDSYQLPDAKGYSSMVRHLTGGSDAYRQQIRDEILSTTPANFREFADVLDGLKGNGLVVVLGSGDAMAAANAQKGDAWLRVTKVM